MSYSLMEKFDLIEQRLLDSKETDALGLIRGIMEEDWIDIHGSEHHFLDGGALLVAINNAGLPFDLVKAIAELKVRAIKMPGAMCGLWGVCGSVASIGACFSIIDGTGPLSGDANYSDHMELTSKIVGMMGKIGGPRCCKRNAFISVSEGIKHANAKYHLNLPLNLQTCRFSPLNKQCLHEKCPFNAAFGVKKKAAKGV